MPISWPGDAAGPRPRQPPLRPPAKSSPSEPARKCVSGNRPRRRGQAISGRMSKLKARLPGPVHQRLEPRPRPAVWRSARIRRGSFTFAKAAHSIARSLVEPISGVVLQVGDEGFFENFPQVLHSRLDGSAEDWYFLPRLFCGSIFLRETEPHYSVVAKCDRNQVERFS